MTNSQSGATSISTRIRNLIIVLGAVAISIVLFLGLQSNNPSFSLEKQAETATPLEVALNNEKPTLIEFYANWCSSCQAMAKDIGELKEKYNENINFVMLNVDNEKWLPEMLQYQVNGIPHFAFLDKEGSTIAAAIGEQPRSVLENNLKALAKNETLPDQGRQGQTSQVESSTPRQESQPEIQPRSHSN